MISPVIMLQGKWITATVLSILQILVLAIPILIITDNNNDAFYFVSAAVIFLTSFTATALIFIPKMYRQHFQKAERRGNVQGTRSSVASIRRSSTASYGESQVSRQHSLAHGLAGSGPKHSIICSNCQTVNEIPQVEKKPKVLRKRRFTSSNQSVSGASVSGASVNIESINEVSVASANIESINEVDDEEADEESNRSDNSNKPKLTRLSSGHLTDHGVVMMMTNTK